MKIHAKVLNHMFSKGRISKITGLWTGPESYDFGFPPIRKIMIWYHWFIVWVLYFCIVFYYCWMCFATFPIDSATFANLVQILCFWPSDSSKTYGLLLLLKFLYFVTTFAMLCNILQHFPEGLHHSLKSNANSIILALSISSLAHVCFIQYMVAWPNTPSTLDSLYEHVNGFAPEWLPNLSIGFATGNNATPTHSRPRLGFGGAFWTLMESLVSEYAPRRRVRI